MVFAATIIYVNHTICGMLLLFECAYVISNRITSIHHCLTTCVVRNVSISTAIFLRFYEGHTQTGVIPKRIFNQMTAAQAVIAHCEMAGPLSVTCEVLITICPHFEI